MSVIRVNLGRRSYPVVIGSNMAPRLPGQLKKVTGEGRLFVVYDAQVYALHGPDLDPVLNSFAETINFVVPAGERSKSQGQLNRLRDFLLSEKINRADTIVAVGGGVVSDLVGYAAATTLRGIDWVIIPTTLLAMVDAAIGGKTGVNHSRGKNLIGAFWQPRLVWSDTRYLMTLPDREIVAGLGEVLKYAGLSGKAIMMPLSNFVGSAGINESTEFQNLIRPCVEYKARIVEVDERDNNRRMFLNFGHTFSHAIETATGHGRLRHGEALIVGLRAALHLSRVYFPEGQKALSEYDRLVDSFEQMVPRRKINLKVLAKALALDKKRSKTSLNFILLQKPGRPIIITDVKLRDVEASLRHALNGFELSGKFNG